MARRPNYPQLGWHQLDAMSLVTATTARIVNRVFVGQFFCKNVTAG